MIPAHLVEKDPPKACRVCSPFVDIDLVKRQNDESGAMDARQVGRTAKVERPDCIGLNIAPSRR